MWRWRRSRDEDFGQEIQAHIALDTDRLIAEGMSPEEARTAALRAFGNVTRTQEQFYESRRIRWVEELVRDIRYARRTLAKTPGFTAIAIVTLALGIGANTAMFSFIDAILLAGLPYPHADRLVSLWEQRPSGERNAMSPLNYRDYAERSALFEQVAATTFCCGSMVLGTGAAPTDLIGFRVSASYFDIFGTKAALGRTFVAGDDQPGRDHVVVLSHKIWISHFGADAALIGQSIRLNGDAYTVIGVMPPGIYDRSLTQIWVPLSLPPAQMTRISHWLLSPNGGAVALLKPGVSVETARAELQTLSARMAAEYPDTNAGWGVIVEPYAATLVGAEGIQLLLLGLAAVGVVLLIGCVNLANFMLARGLVRHREVAIRLSLGADRGRLVRELMTESILLSICGGLLGVGLSYAIIAMLTSAFLGQPLNPSMPPTWIPAEATIGIDRHVLLFALAISTLTAIGCGLLPAIWNTRLVPDASVGLQRRASVHGTHRRLHAALIVMELGLTFLLLTGAGLLVRSFLNMREADPGFSGTNVLTATLPIWEHRFSSAAQLRGYQRRITDAIAAVPGVRDVALTDGLPLQGVPTVRLFQIVGHPVADSARRPMCLFKVASPAYFRAMDLHLRTGRALLDQDRLEAPYVTVINEAMATQYFPGVDPVGQHLLLGDVRPGTTDEIRWTIVGVIADERLTPFDDPVATRPAVYVPIDQAPSIFVAGLVVRAATDPQGVAEPIRRALMALDQDQAMTNVRTVDQIKADAVAPARLRSKFLGLFAAVALLLSAIGVYGVFAYAVAQRTREIGIRAALGASERDVLMLVFHRAFILLAIGLVLGAVGALGVNQLLASLLYDVSPRDPATLATVAALLAGVALAACYVPARRATRADPIVALRSE